MTLHRPMCFIIATAAALLTLGGAASSADNDKPRKCIMVFGAHADDVEGLAGGTLAKYVADGYEASYVVVTNNTAGCVLESTPNPRYMRGTRFTVSSSPKTYPVEALETNQIRSEEARAAAALYHTEPVFLDFREIFIWQGRKQCYLGSEEFHAYDPPGRQAVATATVLSEDVDFVVNLLRKVKPEIVIIHALGGDKLEHGNSGYLMYKAFAKAIQQRIPVGKLCMKVNGWLLDKYAQRNGRGKADMVVDIKDYLKAKYAVYSMHTSQKGILYREYVERGEVKPEEMVEQFITVIDNTQPGLNTPVVP